MSYKKNNVTIGNNTYVNLGAKIAGVKEDSSMNRRLLPQTEIEGLIDAAWNKIISGNAQASEVARAEQVILEVARVDKEYATILAAQIELARGHAELSDRVRHVAPSALIAIPERAAYRFPPELRSPLIR